MITAFGKKILSWKGLAFAVFFIGFTLFLSTIVGVALGNSFHETLRNKITWFIILFGFSACRVCLFFAGNRWSDPKKDLDKLIFGKDFEDNVIEYLKNSNNHAGTIDDFRALVSSLIEGGFSTFYNYDTFYLLKHSVETVDCSKNRNSCGLIIPYYSTEPIPNYTNGKICYRRMRLKFSYGSPKVVLDIVANCNKYHLDTYYCSEISPMGKDEKEFVENGNFIFETKKDFMLAVAYCKAVAKGIEKQKALDEQRKLTSKIQGEKGYWSLDSEKRKILRMEENEIDKMIKE